MNLGEEFKFLCEKRIFPIPASIDLAYLKEGTKDFPNIVLRKWFQRFFTVGAEFPFNTSNPTPTKRDLLSFVSKNVSK